MRVSLIILASLRTFCYTAGMRWQNYFSKCRQPAVFFSSVVRIVLIASIDDVSHVPVCAAVVVIVCHGHLIEMRNIPIRIDKICQLEEQFVIDLFLNNVFVRPGLRVGFREGPGRSFDELFYVFRQLRDGNFLLKFYFSQPFL